MAKIILQVRRKKEEARAKERRQEKEKEKVSSTLTVNHFKGDAAALCGRRVMMLFFSMKECRFDHQNPSIHPSKCDDVMLCDNIDNVYNVEYVDSAMISYQKVMSHGEKELWESGDWRDHVKDLNASFSKVIRTMRLVTMLTMTIC